MSINVGDKIPAVTVKKLGDDGMNDVDTGKLFAGKKVILFGVPGAYTPTCSNTHLPGYVENAGALKEKGVDAIVCMSVNDPFVMKAWGEAHNVGDKVMMLPDGNGKFTSALGLQLDGSGAGLGTRCKRFSLIAEDGVVKELNVEDVASAVEVSGASACLAKL